MRRSISFSIIGLGFLCFTGFSPQIALPTFQGAQARSQSDSESPIITITASDGSNAVANNSITNDATLSLTFTANENVTGFAIGDIGSIGGSLSSFSGSNATYTATFTPSSNRNTVVYIPKEVYTDASSNNNINSFPFYWTYDGTAPVYLAGTYITGNNSKVKIRLSETVYDTDGGTGALEVGDFTLSISGGSATLGSTNPTAITKDTPTFSSTTLDNNLNGAFGLELVDLDFDGDMDIVATGIDADDINWYENDGSENFTETLIDGNLNGALGLEINDIDGDGDLDIFATAFVGGSVVWYENNGSQSFTKSTIATLAAAYDVRVNDLDGDGDMDVIASGRNANKMVWYANDGSQSFTENTIDNSVDGPANFDVEDVDEDGDLDLIVATLDDSDVVFYQNDGSESFTKNTIDSNLPSARDVIIADIDSDGDLDAVATSSNTSGNDLVWYANDGSGNFTSNVIGDNINFTNYLQVADIDGDNDQDILVTMHDAGDLIWFENDGSQNFTSNTIEGNLAGTAEVKVADIDGDGDLDAVLTARVADDMVFYTNSDSGYVLDISLTGTPDGTETLTISPTSNSIFDIAGNAASTSQSNSTVTLNDQRITMAITAVNGSSSAVSDGSTTNDATLTVTFTSSAATTNFIVGDVTVSGGALSSFSGSGTTYTATFTPTADGATTIDVAAGTFTDASGYSNAAATQFNWTYDSTGPLITITATDGSNAVANNSTTNDGTLSVTFTANETITGFAAEDVGVVGGTLSSFSGSGATYTATFTPSSDRNTMIYIPSAGFTDVATNNNFASIPFYWTYDGTAPVYVSGTYVTGNNGKVKVRLSETVYDTNGGTGALETGDFTLSISGGSATLGSTNPTAITKDTPTFIAATIDNNLSKAQGLQLADLDFDGDMDIIACGYNADDINWYENDGSGNFTERAIDLNVNAPQGLAVNDIDGDGDLDIFVTSRLDDQVLLYTNNGSQSFTKSIIDSDLDGPHHVECADLNDDGYMDVIATGRVSDKIIWYSNDGTQTFTENVLNDGLDGAITFFISDVDEDGDKDIVVAELDGHKVTYLSNDGSENFTETTIDNVNRVRAVAAADVDGDGDIDLAATGDGSSDSNLIWYSNDGSENFTENTIESSIGSANHLQIADIDGDNDEDIIITSFQDDDVLWYSNDGSQNFSKSFIDNNIDGASYVKVGDMDGDGDLDIVATGQNAGDILIYTNSDSGYVLDISLTGTPDGTETLTILPTSASIYDFVGNVASTSQSNSTVTLNDQRITMAITAVNGSSSAVSDGSTTNDATLTVTFTSSAATTNFIVGDVTVSGGALSSFSGSGTTYTATFTPTADGATTIDVAAGTFTDASGYSNVAATQFNWTYDGTSPYVAITATDGSNAVANNSITNDATLSLTFTANESVTGFAIGDIGTFGGSVSSFSGSGNSYTATFTPSGDRNTGIYLPTNTYTDIPTNNNLGSIPFYWRYDATAPTIVSGTSVASDNSTVTVKLSELVYDTNSGSGALEVGDFAFSISGGLGTLASATPTSISKANPSFTDSQVATPDGPQSVRTVDLDLDNDMDLIVPAFDDDIILWYENNGSQSFTQRTVGSGIDGPKETYPVDLDLDGDMDIVSAIYNDKDLLWYDNDGSQNFTKRTIDASLAGNGNHCTVVDLDGDNDLDIVVGTLNNNSLSWYENDGSQSFTKNSIGTGFASNLPVVIDLDEDGDLDMVMRTFEGGEKLRWFENNGSESFTQNLIDNSNGGGLKVIDLDEDGDYDVVSADGNNGHVNWFANNGSESFTKNTIDNSGMSDVVCIGVGDIDGDGDIDVAAAQASYNGSADDKIVWYANNGSESFTEYTVETGLNYPGQFELLDIDGDKDLDMVSAAREGDEIKFYENVDGGYVLGLSLSATPNGSETLTVNPTSSAIFDVAGNAASTSQSNNTVTLNNQRISMAITAVNGSSSAVSDGSATNDATLTVTFTSSAATTNFAVGDITVSGGSLSSFSGSGTTYTATFTPTAEGATTIDVAAGTFTDANGYSNAAATQFNWTYDSTSPIITITASDGSNAISNNSKTNDSSISLTFTANESITGFAAGDVGVVGGTLSSFSGSGATYTATFTPSSDRNTMIYIAAGGYTDAATNNNLASIPFYWTYDGTAPVYVSGTYVTGNNGKVKVRLSETVYDTNGGTGALETGDFTLSISGGSATLGSTNPTAITKDTPTFSSTTLDNNLNGAYGLELVDLDFDGDMDIVATGIDADDINWYENDGSENFTETLIDGNLNGALGLAIKDIDGDGDLDIFATAYVGGSVVWYENNGSQSFTKSTIATLSGAYDVRVNDLDGDGDMDVIASGGAYVADKMVWYANDGSQSFTENTIDNSIDGPANFDVKDVDEDGDLDLIVAALDANDVVFYQNDGSESFTKNTIDSNLPTVRDVIIADIDSDGDFDAVATSSSTSGNDLVWYANDGSENFTSNVIGDDLNFTNYLQVADIDGDNDQDILVTMKDAGDLIWYENDGSQNFTSNTIENNLNGITEVKVADVDGDGDLDAVATARVADDIVFYTNSDSGYVLDISLTGTPDGTETLTILPTSTSIYDFAGNAASTSQSNNTVTLNNQRISMTITAVNGSSSAVSDGSTTNDATLRYLHQ